MGRTSSSKPTTSENAREALRKLIIYYQFEKHTQINILGRYLRPEVISVTKTKMGLKKQQIHNIRKCNVKVYNLHQIFFLTFACTFLEFHSRDGRFADSMSPVLRLSIPTF